MMNILKKIKIDYLTYFFLIICLITGLIKNILIIFFIILVHEFGHIIFIKMFDYEINSIKIYPFGGITEVNKDINSPINHDFLISLAGVIFQLFLFPIFIILINNNVINLSTFNLFLNYNKSIMFFNLLPIVPLDGHIILKSLFEKIFTFKKSYILINIISIVAILLFATFNYVYSVNNYMIIILLIYKTFLNIKNYNFIYNKFLLERYINQYPYKKIREEKNLSCEVLRKEVLHFFKVGDKLVSEKTLLKKRFDK